MRRGSMMRVRNSPSPNLGEREWLTNYIRFLINVRIVELAMQRCLTAIKIVSAGVGNVTSRLSIKFQ